jgi:hypothetical protein
MFYSTNQSYHWKLNQAEVARKVLEKQLTDILKRRISNVATFEKVRENGTGKKSTGKKIREKKYGKNIKEYGEKMYGGKNTGKKVLKKYGKIIREKKYEKSTG